MDHGETPVGDSHIHFFESLTAIAEGHRNEFRLATFIDDPIGE